MYHTFDAVQRVVTLAIHNMLKIEEKQINDNQTDTKSIKRLQPKGFEVWQYPKKKQNKLVKRTILSATRRPLTPTPYFIAESFGNATNVMLIPFPFRQV